MHFRTFSFIALIILPLFAKAQKIDNQIGYRNIDGSRYLGINYENDFFTGTDRNYTQGYNLELIAPFLRGNPINRLFIKRPKTKNQFGLAFEHIGFTPLDFVAPEIQVADRPFASTFMLKSMMNSIDTIRNSRITQSMSLGVIGPATLGKEMQTRIHEITGDAIPGGWDNQISNDLVINYNLGYEKQLLNYKDVASLHGTSNLQLGTLFTNASVGPYIMIGFFDNPYNSGSKNIQLYLYGHPHVSIVGYDATLQGGLFNNNSPYTISAADIERITTHLNYGFIVKFYGVYFEYSRSMLSKQYESGESTSWGGLKSSTHFDETKKELLVMRSSFTF